MTKYAKCSECRYVIAIPNDKNSSDYVCPNDGNTLTDATESEYDESTHIKGPYSAIVYKDGDGVYAEDANGTTIAEGEAGEDDASVIQSAINVGHKVFLSDDIFNLSNKIRIGESENLMGAGMGATVLQKANGFADGCLIEIKDSAHYPYVGHLTLNDGNRAIIGLKSSGMIWNRIEYVDSRSCDVGFLISGGTNLNYHASLIGLVGYENNIGIKFIKDGTGYCSSHDLVASHFYKCNQYGIIIDGAQDIRVLGGEASGYNTGTASVWVTNSGRAIFRSLYTEGLPVPYKVDAGSFAAIIHPQIKTGQIIGIGSVNIEPLYSRQYAELIDDFIGDLKPYWSTSVSGSGSVSEGQFFGRAGIIVLDTGDTSDSVASIKSPTKWIFNTGVPTFSCKARVKHLGDTKVLFGMGTTPTSTLGNLRFRYESSVSSNWLVDSYKDDSGTTVDTGVAVDTEFYNFKLVYQSSSKVWGLINGNVVAEITTNIATGQDWTPYFYIKNTAAAEKKLYVDWVHVYFIPLLR